MSEPDDRPSPDAWGTPRQVMPAHEVIPDFARLGIDEWLPVVLVQDGRRVAVVVGWDWWAAQHERYLHAAAVGWAHWRDGTFDAQGFGWSVLPYLSPPQPPPVHPEPAPPWGHVDDESEDDGDGDVRPG